MQQSWTLTSVKTGILLLPKSAAKKAPMTQQKSLSKQPGHDVLLALNSSTAHQFPWLPLCQAALATFQAQHNPSTSPPSQGGCPGHTV